MIVLGSVAKDDKGFLIETKFYTSGGRLIHSQLARARNEGASRGRPRTLPPPSSPSSPSRGP